jgi:hypothetical protein
MKRREFAKKAVLGALAAGSGGGGGGPANDHHA